MLLLLTLGFLPPEAVEAPPLTLARLARTPAVQGALNGRSDVAGFRDRWGVTWLRWDERNSTPRAFLAEGIPAAEVDELVDELAGIAGIDPGDLVLSGTTERGDRIGWHYVQTHEGALVEHAWLDLVGQHGRVTGGFSSLHRPRLPGPPEADEVVLPLEGDGLRYAWARSYDQDDERVFVARDGRELLRYSLRHYLDITANERTVGDPLATWPARDVQLSNDGGVGNTDDFGNASLAAPYDVRLQGQYLEVKESADGTATAYGVEDEVVDAEVDVTHAASVSQVHFHVVRDWLEERWPEHTWLPSRVPSTVNIASSSCNAYYTGGTINFYVGEEGRCNNLGEIADVVYHEYGHGLHTYILEGGSFASDISEGSADYVSATINDDPVLAPNAGADGGAIRELDTDKRYPEDQNGEVHNDGLIWGSFLWNLREQWSSTYGDEDGVYATDMLFLEALSMGPAMTDLFEAVVLADDDNGDLADGTPHLCELVELLGRHGLADELGLVIPEHTPVDHQGSAQDGYEAAFTLQNVTDDCGAFDPDSAQLHYTVDPDLDASLAELSFETVAATRVDESYTAVIPRQFPGSVVAYYLSWSSYGEAGDSGLLPVEPVTETTHGGRTDQLYVFTVGDREALWCDDFESGWGDWTHGTGLPLSSTSGDGDQWELGEPTGTGTFDPGEAWSGSAVLGTALADTGEYAANMQQWALSPAIQAPVEHNADRWLYALATRRWLTVEDGYFDQARIQVYDGELDPSDWAADSGFDTGWEAPPPALGETLWSNHATPTSDGASEHTLDTSWFGHDVDLRGVVTPGDPVRFAWTLASDGGLEYGGWHLDDVCVVTLADVPGHYRVQDLAVTRDAGEASVSFTWPFMAPLYGGAVVRSVGGPPSSPDDGTLLLWEVAPEPGAEVLLSDAPPESDVYYAVFSADDEDWYLDTVENENLVLSLLDADAPSDSDDPAATDTGSEGVHGAADLAAFRPEPDCACATGAAGAAWTLPWLAGLVATRRRRVASR